MRLAVQVVGVGDAGDSHPALLVAAGGQRFLFNAGEGLQRFCMEHRVRLARVDGIFLTSVGAETMGGLPGAYACLAAWVHVYVSRRRRRPERRHATAAAFHTPLYAQA